MARGRAALAAVCMTALLCVPASVATFSTGNVAAVACHTAADPTATSLLLVGDSVTQGSTGDWTWRYRLWKHLVATGASVDLVGPRDDLFDRRTATFGNHEYADPAFDQDHAARWGMAFANQDYPIGELVSACRPDVVVEALGYNDLTWFSEQPQTVLDQARSFVAAARAADPGVDVVLVALPQTWTAGAAEYDQALAGLASELDTPASRVVEADTSTGFVEWVDTYDPAHLTATGEVKMAADVADALATIGVGAPYPRPLPQVANGPTRPAALSASAGDGTASLSWSLPPGADGVYVWVRDATIGESWKRFATFFTDSPGSWTVEGLINYHHYRFRLQAAKGSAVAEHLFSDVVRVTPHPPAPARVRLSLTPGVHRITARWTASAGATSYTVSWKRRGSDRPAQVRRTAGTSLRIDRLASHRWYVVGVRPWNDRTPGRVTTAQARPR